MKKLLAVLLLLYPLSAVADTYEWTDERGTVNFAEDLGKVPKKYRKRAKKLGAEEEAPVPASVKDAAPAAAKPKGEESGKKLFGGKDEVAWRREFLQANSNLQNAQSELAALQGRLVDTSRMSRSEYLAIQNSIKHAETRVQAQQNKLEQLQETADRYGVPAEFRK